jgi:hypothetical protein
VEQEEELSDNIAKLGLAIKEAVDAAQLIG